MDGEFDWMTLEAGEEVIWSDNPHVLSIAPTVIVGIPLSIVLIGIVMIVGAWLSRENTEYVVTTEAVYRKSGILSRDVKRIEFEKIQDTSLSQSAVGSQFGYGTVGIRTAGGSGTDMEFRSVEEPAAVQERINRRIHEVKGGDGETDASKAEVLEDILTELRAIRGAIETGRSGETIGTRTRDGQEAVAGDRETDGSERLGE